MKKKEAPKPEYLPPPLTKPILLTGGDIDQGHVPRRPWKNNYKGGLVGLRASQALAVVGFSVAVLGFQIGFSETTEQPYFGYVIEKDDVGDVSFRGFLNQAAVTLDDSLVKSTLKRFIKDFRGVSSDATVTSAARTHSGYLVSAQGTAQLRSVLDSYDVDKMLANHVTVDLQFDYFTHVKETSWLVHWTEIQSKNGLVSDRHPMVGTFTYSRGIPKGPEWAINNPTQMYFDSFSITEAER